MVRLGPVRTRPDDRLEARSFGTEPADLGVDGQAELVLGRVLVEQVADVRERGGGDRRRGLDARDLAVVLHDPQRLDEAGGRHELLHERQMRARHRPLVGPADGVRFEPEAQPGGGDAEDLVLGGHREADADVGLDAGRRELLGSLVAVAAVGDQQELVGQDQQHARRAGEAGEIADVDELRDEQRVARVLARRRTGRAGGRRVPATSIRGRLSMIVTHRLSNSAIACAASR